MVVDRAVFVWSLLVWSGSWWLCVLVWRSVWVWDVVEVPLLGVGAEVGLWRFGEAKASSVCFPVRKILARLVSVGC